MDARDRLIELIAWQVRRGLTDPEAVREINEALEQFQMEVA